MVRMLIIFIFFAVVIHPGVAYAYIDPTTGGTLYQILFLIFSAGVVVLVFLKNKIVDATGAVLRLIRGLLSI